MPRRLREYHRPADLNDALGVLRRPATVPLVIGPRVPDALYASVEAVVDLSPLNLAYIREAGGSIHLGALTPLQDIVASGLVKSQAHGLLSEAAQFSAALGLRHVATVGGVLLEREGPPEVLLALSVLETTVVAKGPQTRDMPLTDFLAMGREPLPGELIVAVKFDRLPAHVGGALERVARTPRDAAIVAAAALVEAEADVCHRVRLALAGAGPRPQRLVSVEKMLEGQVPTSERLQAVAKVVEAEMNPATDSRASAEYRRATAGVLARRALEAAWDRARAAH